MAKVGILSLGCPRNLVDSEIILGSLRSRGFEIKELEDGVDVAIVNTCAFIEDAKNESIEAILQASSLKKEGRIKHIVVCGCLAQRYSRELGVGLPEVDSFVGTSDFVKIPEIIDELLKGKKRSAVSGDLGYIYDEDCPRHLLTPEHYAYVKISEGCNNSCSYCVIGNLRGRFRSRPIESVVAEVRNLSGEAGLLKEINLIGQDTTQYGLDIYGRPRLSELLRSLTSLKISAKWVRLLYTHPAHYDDEVIEVIAGDDKICKYLDLPVQHISDKILSRMNRRVAKTDILHLIDKLRKRIGGLTIRTSIIVGFPGETEEDFNELLDFVRVVKFERLGAFVYSREENTPAYGFPDQVPEEVKMRRFDELMRLQRSISEDINRTLLGKEVSCLIDEIEDGSSGYFIGRTQGDAPEVDGVVHLKGGRDLSVGQFVRARIVDTLEYDLVGEVISEST